MFTFNEHLKMKRKYVSCDIGSTSYFLAIQLSAIQPYICGYIAKSYIARNIWLHSQVYLAIEFSAIQPDISGCIARHTYLAIQLLAIQPHILAIQLRAIQPVNSQLATFVLDISGMNSHQPYNPIFGAIQPNISGHIVSQKTGKLASIYSQI